MANGYGPGGSGATDDPGVPPIPGDDPLVTGKYPDGTPVGPAGRAEMARLRGGAPTMSPTSVPSPDPQAIMGVIKALLGGSGGAPNLTRSMAAPPPAPGSAPVTPPPTGGLPRLFTLPGAQPGAVPTLPQYSVPKASLPDVSGIVPPVTIGAPNLSNAVENPATAQDVGASKPAIYSLPGGGNAVAGAPPTVAAKVVDSSPPDDSVAGDAAKQARDASALESDQGKMKGIGGTQEYTVVRGDNLRSIAQKMYGDPNAWQRIALANGITNPNRIFYGRTLIIPGSDTAGLPGQLSRGQPGAVAPWAQKGFKAPKPRVRPNTPQQTSSADTEDGTAES